MPGIQFSNQIDMNGNLITELAPGVAGTDGANINQLNASSPQGYAETIGDGVATTFVITHNLSTSDVITSVYEISTGNYIFADVSIDSVNAVEASFSVAPTSGQYRVLVIPVP